MYGPLYRHVLLPLFDRVIKGRRTMQYWREAEQNQWLSREELERRQLIALQNLLRHAAQTCPYYRDAWRAAGLEPDSVQSLADFCRWPLVTRADIVAHRPQMRTTLDLRLMSKATGGSSGEPVRFDLNSDSNDRRTAMMWRGYHWAGGPPGTKQLYVWGGPVGPIPAWKRWKMHLHRRIDRQHVINCFDFAPEKMRSQHERWNRYRPEVVVAYTTPLYEFARFIEQESLPIFSPKSIIVGAEKLHRFQREQLERVFQAPVFETYGSREFMLIGAECDRHTGLHLSLDNLLVEVLDEDGRPTSRGEEGNVVVTDLFNYGMPFIRYVNGDRAVAGFEICACGRGLPLLKKVIGRQLDMLETPDGRRIPGEFFPHLFKEYPAVRRFQVVQSTSAAITIKLVLVRELTLTEREHLVGEIRKCVGNQVAIHWETVEDIPLTKAGKLRVVIRQG